MRSLTRRQRQILELIANEGLTDQQIATRLGIAEATVGVHLTKALRVIHAPSRTAAAAWTWQHGFIWRDSEARRIALGEPA